MSYRNLLILIGAILLLASPPLVEKALANAQPGARFWNLLDGGRIAYNPDGSIYYLHPTGRPGAPIRLAPNQAKGIIQNDQRLRARKAAPAASPAPAPSRPAAVPFYNHGGITYENRSAGAQLSPNRVALGQSIRIATPALAYGASDDIRVILDGARGPGFGVQGFRLTGVRASGNTLTCQIPAGSFLSQRWFIVRVYVFRSGQRPQYVYAGSLFIQ